MENQKNDFLNGPILSPLLRFAGPVLLALFLQAMYGAVDLIVVGKFAGTADISAVSTGSQAMQLVTSLLVGLTTGVTVLLGQKIGEGRPDEAGSVVGSAICLFVCVALALTALLSALTKPFCRLLQAPEEAFVPTTQYVRICSAGTLFIVAFNVIGSVFRGLGDSKMPLITVAIACVTNIFGDLLLVDVFQMGAAGAALATVFAQAVSVILSLFVIMRRKLPFTFRKEQLRFNRLAHSRNSASRHSDCAAGRAGRRVVPRHSGYCQFSGTLAVCRHGHCGKGLRVRHAAAVGIFSIRVRVCRAEYRRR